MMRRLWPLRRSGLDTRLERALTERGFETTMPIQSAVFPAVLAGIDLVACAQTGTGKTLAFLLPLMQRLLGASGTSTRVLILAPTRELAVQIEDEFQGLAYHTNLSSVAVYGGVEAGPQERGLRGAADIVVATPGRLLDHMGTNAARFDALDVLVLDEADRMLDMGFWPSVRRIVASLPAKRQTLLFSATMSDEVAVSASQIMQSPKMIRVGRTEGLASTIEHIGRLVPGAEKADWLGKFLRRTEGTSLVFVRTKRGADKARPSIVGERDQVRRASCGPDADRTLGRDGRVQVGPVPGAHRDRHRGARHRHRGHRSRRELRGAGSVDTYVHRVGRTGRAEAVGKALTLIAPEELTALRAIEKSLNVSFAVA
jgi:ATP-dependent RNA helicase RhlE